MADESKSAAAAGEVVCTAARIHEFGGPENFRLDADVVVAAPGAGQVRVNVAYAGVNPVDTYIRAGAYARKPALPYIPGADGSGIVESVGDGVKSVKVGDHVRFQCKTGSYTTVVLCAEADVHKLPDSLPLAAGAAVGVPYYTAYRALFYSTKVSPGEWVMIHGGSGGVGVAAIQLAVDYGCKVIATAGTDAGLELVKRMGACVAINHRGGETKEKVMEATNGAGVNVIIEMLANVNLDNDLKMLARNGRVGVVGNRGEIKINPRDLMARQAYVIGVMLGGSTDAEREVAAAYINAKLSSGVLVPLVGEEFALADAGAAHVAVIEHKSGSNGKIVLKCRD